MFGVGEQMSFKSPPALNTNVGNNWVGSVDGDVEGYRHHEVENNRIFQKTEP